MTATIHQFRPRLAIPEPPPLTPAELARQIGYQIAQAVAAGDGCRIRGLTRDMGILADLVDEHRQGLGGHAE